MTPRIVAGLAVVAALSVGAAAWSYRAGHPNLAVAGVGERLLPELVERVNDVAEITVAQGERSLTVKAEGDGWVVADSGFPASSEKVRRALVGLARLSRLEPKTAIPAKYALIEVDGPGTAEAKGRLVTLKDAAGATVAAVVLGKPAAGRAGPGQEAQYARLADEARSWLVAGRVDAAPELRQWADTTLLSLNVDTVAAARFRHPDGEVVEVKKTGNTDHGAAKFEIVDLPEGKKPKSDITVRYAATDLANIEFVDVRRRKDDRQPVSEAELETDQGLKLGFSLVEEDGRGWLAIRVLDKGKDAETADAIASKAEGWEFALADYKAKQFQKRLSDLVE